MNITLCNDIALTFAKNRCEAYEYLYIEEKSYIFLVQYQCDS